MNVSRQDHAVCRHHGSKSQRGQLSVGTHHKKKKNCKICEEIVHLKQIQSDKFYLFNMVIYRVNHAKFMNNNWNIKRITINRNKTQSGNYFKRHILNHTLQSGLSTIIYEHTSSNMVLRFMTSTNYAGEIDI